MTDSTSSASHEPVNKKNDDSDGGSGGVTATVTEKPLEEEEAHDQWDNEFQFILTCIGLAVGLGNIWRFPAMAFDNGGSAFLFPYITCAIVFGLPMVYAEFIIGQWTRCGPPSAFKRYAPAFQGLGWSTGLLAASVSIYYTVIVAWAAVYIYGVMSGTSSQWTKCDNEWNNEYCMDLEKNKVCRKEYPVNSSTKYVPISPDGGFHVHFKNACYPIHSNASNLMMLPAEQYFNKYVVARSTKLTDFGEGINWPTFVALLIMWIIVALTLFKGTKIMGKAAYFTSTMPYIIIAILFVRGVTLEGAGTGIEWYLGKPQWEYVLLPRTWARALSQLLFSLSVGYGGLITLSSYSKRNNNCFRDALIVIVGDTFMSLFGGVAVFSTMGFLANEMGREIKDIVKGGTSLAFIVYPEAIARMPVSPLFHFLFFFMLFCLGISTEVSLVEVLCTCIYDQFPKTKKMKWAVVGSVCTTFFLLGIIMTTGAGWYWFNIYNGFTGTTAACVIVVLEIIVLAWLYGAKNARDDVAEMLGGPSRHAILRWIGPHSRYFGWMWKFVCPVLGSIIAVVTCISPFEDPLKYDNGDRYPIWAELFGWFLNLCPLFSIPVFFVLNYMENKKAGNRFLALFRYTSLIPSYARLEANKTEKLTAKSSPAVAAASGSGSKDDVKMSSSAEPSQA